VVILSLLTDKQKDVLKALLACAQSWDVHTMSQYSVTLWDSLKYEILSAQDQELAHETLLVLRAIAVNLSRSANHSPTSSPVGQYLKPVIKECIEHLQEPAQRQAKAASDILKAISSADITTFSLIIRSTLTPLFTVYVSADGIIKQRALLEVMNQLFESAISVFGMWRSPMTDIQRVDENPLDPFKDKFLAIYGQALMSTVKEEVSFRMTAAKGLLLLSKMRDLLQDNEIGLIVQHYNEIVLHEGSYARDDLRRTAMQGLADISANKPGLIMEITLPVFLARLPDSSAEADKANNYKVTLEGLAEISVEKEVRETLVRRLLNKLDILLQTNDRSAAYPSAILSTLLYVLEHGTKTGNLEQYYDRVVVGLTQRVVADLRSERSSPLCHCGLLALLGRVDNVILRHSPSKQGHVSANIYTLFTSGLSLASITGAYDTGQLSVGELHLPGDQYGGLPKAMILSTSLLAALPRNHIFDGSEVKEIVTELCQFIVRESERASTDTSVGPVRLACLRQIALYLNKHLPDAKLEIANDLLATCHKSLISTGKVIWIRLIFVIAKALILRLAPNSDSVIADLVLLLHSGMKSDAEQTAARIISAEHSETSKVAAYGFRTLLSDDEILSRENRAQIRLLAPQRVFQILIPLIASRFKQSSDPIEKENCLIALSGVISTVPSELVMSEFSTLLPLLLQSLDLHYETVKTATLETLAVVIARSPSALGESGHVPALVKRLLTNATIPKPVATSGRKTEQVSAKENTHKSVQFPKQDILEVSEPPQVVTDLPKIRRLAVRCLLLMPAHMSSSGGSNPNTLLALKRDVLQGLTKALDDPKRDVRKEAVDARAAWIRGVDDVHGDDSD
jgi:DNA repair/transcription protein MET18/MMS19